jgi:ParB/RepB/Spo0J family partition protein
MTGNNKPGRLTRPIDRGNAVRSLITGSSPGLDRNTEAFYLPLEQLKANPDQPRQTYNPDNEAEMIESVRERGILQPLIVRPLGDGVYQIVAGERRYRAALALGLEKIPVIIRRLSDDEVPIVSLVENLQRADLNPADEQRFFQMLIHQHNFSANDVAGLIHKSPGYVKNRLYGTLQTLQTTEQKPDSDVYNNQSSQDNSLDKSQSKPKQPRTFQPDNAFKIMTKKLVETGEFLEKLPASDLETTEAIRQNLLQLKEQITELEKKLGVNHSAKK